jgi:hypothetical protein
MQKSVCKTLLYCTINKQNRQKSCAGCRCVFLRASFACIIALQTTCCCLLVLVRLQSMLLPAVGVGAAGYGGVRRGMGIHISCKIANCNLHDANRRDSIRPSFSRIEMCCLAHQPVFGPLRKCFNKPYLGTSTTIIICRNSRAWVDRQGDSGGRRHELYGTAPERTGPYARPFCTRVQVRWGNFVTTARTWRRQWDREASDTTRAHSAWHARLLFSRLLRGAEVVF